MTLTLLAGTVFSPMTSASANALPICPESSTPLLASMTFFRSGGSAAYLALFIAKMNAAV